MAAAIAPTPRMIGVDIWEKTREDEVSGAEEVALLRHVQTERHNRDLVSSEPLRLLDSLFTRKMASGQYGKAPPLEGRTEFEILKSSHQYAP